MKKLLLLISTSFFFTMLPLHAIADTYVTENILQDTTWNISGSPYIIQSDIRVYPGVKLTVEPGVEVVIHAGASLIIGGELIARGEPTNLIIFNSNVTIPASNQPAGIIFKNTAVSARFLGGFKPIFSYDHTNREVKLIYESGSILEYCLISGMPTAIELNSSYPYISKSRITGCPLGIRIVAGREIPIPQWFFLYQNTIENCSEQAVFFDFAGSYYFPFALFTGNIIQNNVDNDQAWAVYISHFSGDTFLFLFSNRIINNKGIGIVNNGPYTFLYADNNEIVGNNQGLSAGNAVLLNNTITNNNTYSYPAWATPKGAGVYLNGPRAVLFNNTIQANEICPGGRGDNIMLKSQQGNQFTIQNNNIGNSNGDEIDLHLDTDYQGIDCNTSKNMVVDATNNFWQNRDTNNLLENIYDFTDDFCAGTVNYQPILSTKMTQINLTTPPTLIAPEHNALKPGTLTLNFSWQPVSGATKYLLCTNGWANIPTEAMRIMEVQGQTSAEVTYSPFTSYAQKYVYWFVVAGNENGWSLPSEIRKVYFSMDPYIVGGKVLDENEIPVSEVYIRGEGEGVFSDNNGNYTTIQRDFFREGLVFSLKKEGFSDCYTFHRLSEFFDTFGNLTIISNDAIDEIYNACGIIADFTKGSIAGIVVDENDHVLSGAEVFIEPPSGNIYYLEANNSPDLTLTKTGPSGKFVMLNVAPGYYRISANLDGRNFSITDNHGKTFIGPGITVYENSISVDALVDNSDSGDANGDANGDTDINVQDVICIINVILDTGTASGSPDCNDDGDVNVQDVICVINKILGG